MTETIRTAYGFPTEVLQSEQTLDAYVTRGLLARESFRAPGSFPGDGLRFLLPRLDRDDQGSVGVDFSDGFSNDLASLCIRSVSAASQSHLAGGTSCV